jgi:POT family proton-dependent oligopeptide transporter
MTETAAPLTEPAVAEVVRENKMPSGIPFIISNEFAERYCFYGINAILSIYLTKYLHAGEAVATVGHSFFKVGAYFFPLVGAVFADALWGKFRTIMTFSLVYAAGCTVLALVPGVPGLMIGLFMVAFGTGGIKPCVSTNVGDQFTAKNSHLIERAFSYFYLAINAGSSISIFIAEPLLKIGGPILAFGTPALMMFLAVLVFWLGRKRYVVVPPAGKAWFQEVFSKEGWSLIGRLCSIYVFVACFWALWDQSNGQTFTLQAESSLMDKSVFGFVLDPAQVQVVNGFFILALVPIFSFGVYPLMGKFFTVTPLRKMGIGFFVTASSFLIVARIEAHIQAGETVSVWWQILAYLVLSAAEVLVSITGLEFSYKQAPLKMKSIITALFLLAVAAGNASTALVNYVMERPLHATAIDVGSETWVTLDDASGFVTGQKIDFKGKSGVEVVKAKGEPEPLLGTFLVAETDTTHARLRLMDNVDRKPVETRGAFDPGKGPETTWGKVKAFFMGSSEFEATTYRLVGPEYFNFFAAVMAAMALLFIPVALRYKEKVHVRTEADTAPAT